MHEIVMKSACIDTLRKYRKGLMEAHNTEVLANGNTKASAALGLMIEDCDKEIARIDSL